MIMLVISTSEISPLPSPSYSSKTLRMLDVWSSASASSPSLSKACSTGGWTAHMASSHCCSAALPSTTVGWPFRETYSYLRALLLASFLANFGKPRHVRAHSSSDSYLMSSCITTMCLVITSLLVSALYLW